MNDSKLRNLTIDQALFSLAFDRDVDFHDACPTSTYLDLQTGDIIWVYEDDEDAYMEAGVPADDNRAARESIEATPNRYLEIPGLDHGDHHEILREFLDSDWTDDDERHARARNAYAGSIGGWKKSVDADSIVHAFHAYHDGKTTEMAGAFLREHGIKPDWR